MDTSVVQKNYQKHGKWLKMKDAHAVMASMPSYKEILFSDGKTKLLDCISSMEKPSTLQRFLQNIVDVNTFLPSDSPLWPGCTPLHIAVMFSENMKNERKAASLVKKFLDHGASIQVQNHCGGTALHLAFHLDLPPIVAVLLRHLEKKPQELVNLIDSDKLSYLHIFCTVNDHRTSLARMLLTSQQDIESTVNLAYTGKSLTKVKVGWTPLHVAVDQFQFPLAELLLQRGANPGCKDARGYTPLHLLLSTAETQPLASLFASEQLKDPLVKGDGLTYLHVAVWFNDVEAVERLLNLGANTEATVEPLEGGDLTEYVGCTPLYVAVVKGCYEILQILLRRGADVLARSLDGASPLSEALTDNRKEIVSAFVEMIWTDDHLQKRMEEELGMTMLHLACYAGDLDKVEAQLKKGANPNAIIHDDWNFWMRSMTPLHLLIITSKIWDETHYWVDKRTNLIFRTLVQHGCDVNLEDSTGKTAFHQALTLKSCGYIYSATPEFLSAGADINTVDKSGESAISYALKLYSKNNYRCYFYQINHTISELMLYACKMKLVGMDVNERDEALALAALREHDAVFEFPRQSAFCDQVQATEKIKIGQRGLTLRSFLHETFAVSMYPSLTPVDRAEVDAFFQALDDRSFPDVSPLFKLQHSKAVARLSMIDPARDSLKTFISSDFPDLCVDMILKYLSNLQLKLLIAASIDEYD